MSKLRLKAGSARSRCIAEGFLDGLAAPADLLSGKFETKIVCHPSSMHEAWFEVGRLLDVSIREYGLQHLDQKAAVKEARNRAAHRRHNLRFKGYAKGADTDLQNLKSRDEVKVV